MTLGENIVRLRTQKNWSQGDLADALDISRQSVSKWETDASIPELDKLLKLSELFGVTLDELVRGEDAPKVGNSRARGTGSTRLFHAADFVRAGKASHHCGYDFIVYRCGPSAHLPDTRRRSAGGADLRTAVFPLRHHLLYGEASHGPVVRLGGLYSVLISTSALRPAFRGRPSL